VRIVDTASGADVAAVEQEADARGVAFSGGEEWMATWGVDWATAEKKGLRAVWSAWALGETGGWSFGIPARPGGLMALADDPASQAGSVLLFEPASSVLAVSHLDSVRWYDRRQPRGRDLAPVQAAAAVLDPASAQLRLAGFTGETSVWRLDSGEPVVKPAEGISGTGNGVTVGDDGRLVAWYVAGSEDSIVLTDLTSGRRLRSIAVEGMVSAFTLAGRSRRLAYAYRAQNADRVQVEEADAGAVRATFDPAETVTSLALSPDGERLVVGTPRGISVYDVRSREILSEWPENGGARAVACSPTGGQLAVLDGRGVIHVRQWQGGWVLAALPFYGWTAGGRFDRLAFDSTGAWVWVNRPEPGFPWFWRWRRAELLPAYCSLRLRGVLPQEWREVAGDEPLSALTACLREFPRRP